MKIAIGSTNPVKVQALEEALQGSHLFPKSQVHSCNVPSGISPQPMSLEETIQGAKNRAKNAFGSSSPHLAFGIESGLCQAPGTKSGYLEACVCCIYNGTHYHTGLSCGFEVPPQLLTLILEHKMELAQACFHSGVSSNPNLGAAEGLIGLLTKGRITRKEYTKQAILMALLQLENDELY